MRPVCKSENVQSAFRDHAADLDEKSIEDYASAADFSSDVPLERIDCKACVYQHFLARGAHAENNIRGLFALSGMAGRL